MLKQHVYKGARIALTQTNKCNKYSHNATKCLHDSQYENWPLLSCDHNVLAVIKTQTQHQNHQLGEVDTTIAVFKPTVQFNNNYFLITWQHSQHSKPNSCPFHENGKKMIVTITQQKVMNKNLEKKPHKFALNVNNP